MLYLFTGFIISLFFLICTGIGHFARYYIDSKKDKKSQIIEFSPNSQSETEEENYLSFEENQEEE